MSDKIEMPFWDHLEELRWRILKGLTAVFIGSLISYIFWEEILMILIYPTSNISIKMDLQVLSITSMFIIKISCSILSGIIIALPIIFYQILCFIAPAFESNSIKLMVILSIITSIFFLIGLSFGYFVMVPFSLSFFTNMTTTVLDVKYNFTLENYLYYILWLSLISGLIFQLPVISYFFTKIGIFTPSFLRHYRKYAFVFFLIIGAILTPPDPISQIMIVIPLILLYELSIIISWIFSNKTSY